MRTALLSAAFALTLLTPAFAQDAPEKASGGALARELLADLILAGAKKKVLQHRLFTKRYYRADARRGQVILVIGEGKATGDGFQFQLSFDVLGGDDKAKLTYDFDARGVLRGLDMIQGYEGEGGTRTTIADGVATRQGIYRGEASGKAYQAPWTGDTISLFSALVLIPSLGDLAPETLTKINVVGKDHRIGRPKGRPKEIFFTREEPRKTKDGATQTVTLKHQGRSLPIAKVVIGTGKDQGVIREVILEPKRDGGYNLRFVLTTEKEASELKKIAPLVRNERRAQSALSTIHSAQSEFSKGGEFAASIEDLAAAKLLDDKTLAEGTSPGYLIMLRRSADGQAWMAVAVPDEPRKTGRYYFVTNETGATFRSKKAIELDDSCKIPEGLERAP
jgi:hypothetical protein